MNRLHLILFSALLLSSAYLAGCGSDRGPSGSPDGSVDGMIVDTSDQDGDGISDTEEGQRDRRDTDGDGTPDYLDEDSDGDGIPDSVEAGDEDVATPAADSDSDGAQDFIDLDSDDNGISDAVEGTGDADGDGLLDFADLDDDNDFVPDDQELGEMVTPPYLDTDGDGLPNFRDPDSDNDNILDGHERGVDTDGDGLFDWEDLDSDNDGVSDVDEAGDADVRTQPVDSDSDMIPDFRDPDSDNDGLSDGQEDEAGSSRTAADTDGDGVSDLIEVAAGTDALDAMDSPRTRGDFVFTVPYMEDPDPTSDTLEFRTNIQFADIYFLFDRSGSMSGELSALRTAVSTLIGDITCADTGTACTRDSECAAGQVCSSFTSTCIDDPATSGCLLSPWTGAGYYLSEYRNLLSLQPSASDTATALSFSTTGATESLNRAVWGVADPAGAPGTEENCAAPMAGLIGCPAFREDAVRILVTFTDEDSDGVESSADAGAALRAADINFIGVWSGSTGSSSRTDLVDLATAAGSLDSSGSPLVFDGTDSGVVPVVAAAIDEIVQGVPLRVTIDPTDEPDDAGDSLQFIDYLEVNTSGGACSMVAETEDTDGDGRDDAFPSLLPGTPVCWDVVPLRNETVMPETRPLVFKARLTVRADGSPVDSRVVFFLVPPRIDEPGLE